MAEASTRNPRAARSALKRPKKRGAESAGRIARRERRRDASREEILAGARRVLFRDGIAATTLAAVAKEVGMSKASLYYYYPSKDALFFEMVFGVLESHAKAVASAVAEAKSGGAALRAVVRESVKGFAPRLDDFRLAFLHGQVAGKDAIHFDAKQFARIRPLNDLWFGGAAKLIAEERKRRPGRARVEPRLMAFLAYGAALGLLTMKGMVENLDDPLLYTDDQLVEGLARIFEAAAAQ
ncbi:MAG: TetR family transcriptional regulator [Alphaproteobacteria bacterium]|nr:TetR family transcriptional regulator [Alphaproteobacteria bacterium]